MFRTSKSRECKQTIPGREETTRGEGKLVEGKLLCKLLYDISKLDKKDCKNMFVPCVTQYNYFQIGGVILLYCIHAINKVSP